MENEFDAPETTESTKKEKIKQTVYEWFYGHIHGSPVSRSTEAYNHLYLSLDPLTEALTRAMEE